MWNIEKMQKSKGSTKNLSNPTLSTPMQLDIFHESAVPIDKDFIVTLTKGEKEKVDKESRRTCKILKFSSNWDSDDILTKIYKLDAKAFPNLFAFIIEVKKVEDFEASRITEKLIKFGRNRPIVLQISSDGSIAGENKKTKILSKEDDSDEFHDTKGQKVTTTKSFYNFSTFLWLCMNEKPENLEKKVLKKIQKIKNSSVILKFLKVLKLSDQFFNELVLRYAARGTKSNFLITVDGFDNDKGKIDFLIPKFITDTLIDYKSALQVAIQHSNKDIIELLIKRCTNFIQELPFEHQIEISNAALSKNDIILLCDLLSVADFPFPEDLKALSVKRDARLRRIIKERIKFHKSVLAENITEIKEFEAENPNLKFAYSIKNKSALSQALISKKYESFFHLKSNRHRDNEIENFDDNLEEDAERCKARKLASVQREDNIDSSTPDKDKSVLLLATRSFIYNRNDEIIVEEEQREKIRKWYKDIEKTKLGTKLIDVASQCNDLKIIFDFKCDSVKNVDVSKSQSVQGTTYPRSKWILIGAKSTDSIKRDQEIKGVIAHEICHFVMRLVYQNNEKPYYKDNINAAREFEIIVAEIEAMMKNQGQDTTDAGNVDEDDDEEFQKSFIEEIGIDNKMDNKSIAQIDDECNGIISSVYDYNKDEFHIELIVRPVQIQAQFDDEPDKVAELEAKYKKLFDFCEKVIMPDLVKFNLKQRGIVENFNNFVGFFNDIQDFKVEFAALKDLTAIIDNKLVILSCNNRKLSKLNVYKFLHQKDGDLLEFQNIFIDAKCLQNNFICKNLREILQDQKDLSIFVDCSEGFLSIVDFISPSDELKFVFIVSNDKDSKELCTKMEEMKLVPVKSELHYDWNDLTPESQRMLLNQKIDFQNNSNLTLFEILSNEVVNLEQNLAVSEDLGAIIDDQLLNLLLDKLTISINSQSNQESDEKLFKILFQARKLLKSYQELNFLIPNNGSLSKGTLNTLSNRGSILINQFAAISIQDDIDIISTKILPANIEVVNIFEELTQNQLLDSVKDMKYVLISDKAGSGKTWVLHNLTNSLKDKNPQKWVTYVDLKQFIPLFKSKMPVKFDDFMADKILKLTSNYESKIFKKLYKNGKVCILFDGFDEIAPRCAEFVTQLFQSFQQNGSNQLWIATRDYFEEYLKEELKLEVVYKLDQFTVEHGVELIVYKWMLSDIKDDLNDDKFAGIKKSKKYKKYKKLADKLCEKFPETHTTSIGFPQFYEIIADVSVNNKDSAINATTLQLFEEYINIQYVRWSMDKGSLMTQHNIDSQRMHLNFHKLHQLIAMQTLFPDKSKFCDLDIKDLMDWKEQQIIACGLLTKIGEKIYFLQQTIREFYAADFVRSVLTRQGLKLDEQFCGHLVQFLTVQRFVIIRMFLNEILGVPSIMEKIDEKFPQIAKIFGTKVDKLVSLWHIFDENCTNLVEFLFKVFEKGSFNKVCKILNRNSKIVLAVAKHESLFIKVTDFIVSYHKSTDLRKFIADNQILIQIFDTEADVKLISDFIHKIEDKTDSKFINDCLLAKQHNGENLIFSLIHSKHSNALKFSEALILLQNHITDPKKVFKLLRECNNDNMNVLHLSLQITKPDQVNIFWTELQQHFSNNLEQLQEFVKQKTTKCSYSTLHIAAFSKNIQIHEVLWTKLPQIFTNQEELKELIMQKDKYDNNFVTSLLIHNKADVIEWTFKKFKEVLSNKLYNDILTLKGYNDRTLIQTAVCYSKDLKVHQFLWKFYKELYKIDPIFLESLKAIDKSGYNVFYLAAASTTADIFEFMIQELEALTNPQEIKLILNKQVHSNKNLLQIAAQHNMSLEFHESLWKIVRNYFDESEIMKMISITDSSGDNFFHFAVKFNNVNVVELSWNQIQISVQKLGDKIKFMKKNYEKNLMQNSQSNKRNPEVHKWCSKLLDKNKNDSCMTM